MVENDNLEGFSQTFSQCSLGDDIFQINSQTFDPSIFDQNTPDIDLLCATNEVINCSQKENLIGFTKGKAVIKSSDDSDEENTSTTDFLNDIESKISTCDESNNILTNQDNNHLTNEDVSDNPNENHSSEIENSDLLIKSESRTSVEDDSSEIYFTNSPMFVGAEEVIITTYEEESQNLITEECQIENETQNNDNFDQIHNKKIKLVIKKSNIIDEAPKITDYMEIKKKLSNRGRPLKFNHDIPNLIRVRDPDKLKYLERRYKNNIASQYSRIKRNMKGKQIKIESKELQERNEELIQEREKLQRIKLKLLYELRKRNVDVSSYDDSTYHQ